MPPFAGSWRQHSLTAAEVYLVYALRNDPDAWIEGLSLMALHPIWSNDADDQHPARMLFGVQAVLNAGWTLVFLGLEQLRLG